MVVLVVARFTQSERKAGTRVAKPPYLVILTRVRPLDEEESRDEQHRPERIVEAIAVNDRATAHRLFRAMCAMRSVRAGVRRAKVVSTDSLTDSSHAALLRMGWRRKGGW